MDVDTELRSLPKTVSLAVAAQYLGTTPKTLRNKLSLGDNDFGAVKVLGRWRVLVSVLNDILVTRAACELGEELRARRLAGEAASPTLEEENASLRRVVAQCCRGEVRFVPIPKEA